MCSLPESPMLGYHDFVGDSAARVAHTPASNSNKPTALPSWMWTGSLLRLGREASPSVSTKKSHKSTLESRVWASERAQQVKVPAAKPGDLSSIPWNPVGKGDDQLPPVVFRSTHYGMHTLVHTK